MDIDREGEALLREGLRELSGGAGALPFALAVLRQISRRAGAPAPARTALEIQALLSEAAAGRDEAAAERLSHDHALLSAFFQNADLLYEHGYEGGDAVSTMVLHALHLAVGMEEQGKR